MKYILFLLFALATATLTAQEVSQDSSVIFHQNGQFWKRQTIIYTTGESLVKTTLLGDTAQTVNTYTNAFRALASTLANDARFILTFRRQLNEVVRQAADIEAVTGADPLELIYADSVVFAPGWTISSGGAASQALNFSTTAAGQLRYNIAGGTNRNAFYFGEVIQFRNFPYATGLTGVTVNFYRRADGKYSDLLQNHILIPPGL
jgi:hypothetical protein